MVYLHRLEGGSITRLIAISWRSRLRLEVIYAQDREILQPGFVYVIPAGDPLTFVDTNILGLAAPGSKSNVDHLFASAAHGYRSGVIGVVLSGLDTGGTKHDGAGEQSLGVPACRRRSARPSCSVVRQSFVDATPVICLDASNCGTTCYWRTDVLHGATWRHLPDHCERPQDLFGVLTLKAMSFGALMMLLVAECASNSSVVPMGRGMLSITKQQGSGFAGKWESESRGVPRGFSSWRVAKARLRGRRLLGDETAVNPGQLTPRGSELPMRLTILIAAALVTACSTMSEVQPLGQGRYMVGTSVRGGFTSATEVKAGALARARAFCASLQKNFVLLSSTSSGVQGWTPQNAEVVFTCG